MPIAVANINIPPPINIPHKLLLRQSPPPLLLPPLFSVLYAALIDPLCSIMQYLLVTSSDAEWTQASVADVNGDGVVNAADLSPILANYTILQGKGGIGAPSGSYPGL